MEVHASLWGHDCYVPQLIEALAQGLNILYNQQVVSVDYTSSPVVVTTATGHVYQAPHVICTIPIGCATAAPRVLGDLS